MAVNVTHISDPETRNQDRPFTSVVANCATASDCFPQIVRQKTANFKSPDSPQSPVSRRTRRHFVNDVWLSPFLFSTLRIGTRCAFTLVHGDDAATSFTGKDKQASEPFGSQRRIYGNPTSIS